MFINAKNPASVVVQARLVVAIASLAVIMSIACLAQNVPDAEMATVTDAATSPMQGALSGIGRVTSGAQMLHVTVGHSLFLNTRSRLRRVYVADPSILNSVTLSPNQIVVTAMTSGISSLVLMDEAGQAQSYVVSSDLDIAGLRTALSEAVQGSPLSVEGSGDRVTLSGVVGSADIAATAVKLAGLYSKEVVNALVVTPDHPKQVRLKVRILEVDRTKALQQGINLFNPGGNTSFLAATTTSQYPSTSTLSQSGMGPGTIGQLATSNPLNFMLYSSKLNLGATIQDLESKQILQILAEPTITTISGQTADFLSGGEFPFPIVQPGGVGSSPVVTISFREYGVKLQFTPIVNDDGTIRLTVSPEVSALDYTNSVTISGFTVPALSTRKAQTQVELRSDQSFAISGLLDQRTTDLLSKTPGAASIPILGALFKSRNINHSTTELVVIVTPTLVDPLIVNTPPAQPDLPIPTLNTGAFDKSLGDNLNHDPVAPSLKPGPPYGSPLPAASVNQVLPSTQNNSSTASIPYPTTTSSTNIQADNSIVTQEPQTTVSDSTSSPSLSIATTKQTASVEQLPSNKQYINPYDNISPSKYNETTLTGSDIAASTSSRQPINNYVINSSNYASTTTNNKHAELMVQVMALSNKDDAQFMVKALSQQGYSVTISQSPLDSLLHLVVGPFANKTDAEVVRKRLLIDGYNATVSQ